MRESFMYFVYRSFELKFHISILIQLDCESIISYSIFTDEQYGVLCGNFLILAAPRSLAFSHLQAVNNFSLGTESWTRLQKSVKKRGYKLVIFSAN
jgi:hypothetical protein